MPRSRSIAIQSERVRRCSPRALTAPAMRIAPPFRSSFSVSVVLPASGCEMIAKVRRVRQSAGGRGGIGFAAFGGQCLFGHFSVFVEGDRLPKVRRRHHQSLEFRRPHIRAFATI